MGVRIIGHTLAASAFLYVVGVGLAHIAQAVGDGIKLESRFRTAGGIHRRRRRAGQFPAVGTAHREGEGVPALKLASRDDFFTSQHSTTRIMLIQEIIVPVSIGISIIFRCSRYL